MVTKVASVGKLDHRLALLRPSSATETSYGEPVVTYSVAATIWASRLDASVGESVRAREVGAQISAHFGARYSPETAAVDATWRVQVEGGLTYDVVGVRELRRNQWIEINAVARAEA